MCHISTSSPVSAFYMFLLIQTLILELPLVINSDNFATSIRCYPQIDILLENSRTS